MPVVINDTFVLNLNGEAGAPSGMCGRGDGGWFWGVVQRDAPGCTKGLEWAQLQHVGQSGLSWDNSPDNYWQPNLA